MRKNVMAIAFALAMMFILCGSASAAVPSANFTSNTTNGYAPLSVQFNDTSTGNPTSWNWDFGDGTTSTQQNPKHTYSAVGAYTVKLNVTNGDGNSNLTKKNYITAWNTSSVLPSNNGIVFYVSNDEGVKYDMPDGVNQQGDYASIYLPNTYYITKGGGGMNPVQISTDPTLKSGTKTTTNSQSGTFWIVFSGGIGHMDDAILLLAVNGTIPDDFSVTITSSGYTYTIPAPALTNPSTSSLTDVMWVDNALNETFYKSDFLYGPQSWKPTNSVNYPIYEGQDSSNNFSLMFIDLDVGAFCTNAYPGVTNGSIEVTYSFNNLESFAAFGAYGWFSACNWGTGIPMASNIAQGGYNVMGVPSAEFSANATSVPASTGVQFNDHSTNGPTSWLWDFGDGSTSIEQNPAHVYSQPGVYTVTLTAANAGGNNTVTEMDYITVLDVTAPVIDVNLPNGSYNTTQSVNLTASDDFDQDPVIYYSTNKGSTWSNATKKVTLTLGEGNTTIWYYSKDNAGNSGAIKVASYNIDTTAPAVDSSLAGGVYNTTKTVTLNATDGFDANPVIYYSIDNGVTWHNVTKNITLGLNSGKTTLMYYTEDNMGNKGAVQTATYVIDTSAPTVTASEIGGNYNATQTVTLNVTDDLDQNSTIYYTTDGSDPTVNSNKYTGPISISSTTTLKFMAVDDAGNISPVQTETYTIRSDVYVNITPSKTRPQVGDNVTYTFKVGNNGPGIAQDVVFTYVIPEGLEFKGASVDQGTWQYDEATRTLTWTLGNVTVGDPYLWLNLSVLSAGTFNIQPELSVSGYNPELESNIGSLPVTAVSAPERDGSDDNSSDSGSGSGSASAGNNSSSGSTEGATVHAVTTTTTSTVPMQDTGLPLGGIVSALLLVGSGLALSRKK